VRKSLVNYSPEAPQHVYQSMRKRLWWSNFLKLDMSRLNLWYLLLGLGVATSVAFYALDGKEQTSAVQIEAAPNSIATSNSEQALSSSGTPINSCQSIIGHQTESATACARAASSCCIKPSNDRVKAHHHVQSTESNNGFENGQPAGTSPGIDFFENEAPTQSDAGDIEPYDLNVETTIIQASSEQVTSPSAKPKGRSWLIPVLRDRRK
jgi:hypothetical protein